MHTKPARGGLLIIAIFKLIKGCLLLLLAVGVFGFLHRDARHVVESWINLLRVDPHNKYVAGLMAKLGLVDDRKLRELTGLVGIYACLYLTEGVGLLCRQRWAEYLTVIATASFIPLEIYEIHRHCTAARVLLLVGNLVIIGYLIVIIRKNSTLK